MVSKTEFCRYDVINVLLLIVKSAMGATVYFRKPTLLKLVQDLLVTCTNLSYLPKSLFPDSLIVKKSTNVGDTRYSRFLNGLVVNK